MAAVLEQTRELAIARLTEAVRTVLAVADDALFDFMQKSGGNSNQPHFLDAMRELRRRRGEIEDGFAAQLQHVWRYFVARTEEHTSELQSLMRISYAVSCLKKKTHHTMK